MVEEARPGKPRKWRRWLLLVLGVYAVWIVLNVLVMMIPGVADRLILYPSTHPTDAYGAQRREVPFEKGILELWCARSPGAERAASVRPDAAPAGAAPHQRGLRSDDAGAPSLYVLSFEGNASRAEWAAAPDARVWGERPVEICSVNLPGYGGSTGPARLARLPSAALAAYDALVHEAAGRPIALNGSSLGSTLALYVATQRPVAGLLIRNPPPLQSLIRSPRFSWWNLWLGSSVAAAQVPREMNSLLNAPKITAPAAFVLSTADEVVPPRYQRKVVDAYAGEKVLIELKGGTHNSAFDGSHVGQLVEACEWLWTRAAKETSAERRTE